MFVTQGLRVLNFTFFFARQLSSEPSDAHARTGGGTHYASTLGCESLLVSAYTRGRITVLVFVLPGY
jgi:hypothetical protein